MKKILTIFICTILIAIVVLSMTACDDNSMQKQLDDLQEKLTQQQAQLSELEETLKKVVTPLPHELTIFASASRQWNKENKAYVIYSQEQLQQMLEEFDVAFENEFASNELYFRTDDGTLITADYFQEKALNFNNKALIVTIFRTSSGGVYITRHDLWKNSDVLHVEIDFIQDNWFIVNNLIVIMEVDRSYVTDVSNIKLELTRKSRG